MNIHDHPSALALTASQDGSREASTVREHLTVCLICRVRAGRLRHLTTPGSPSDDAVARILQASAPGPPVLARLTTTHQDGPPCPGELWRVGRDEALLVWVRRVFADSADVVPAVLDIELADQESVVVPAHATPFGMPLALLTGVRGHVGMPAFLERLGSLDVSAQVQEVMAATREGRAPQAVDVGRPIESEDDQRIEYRQVVADLLSELAPSRWPSPIADELSGSDYDDLCGLLSQELPSRHYGTLVSAVPFRPVHAYDTTSLWTCARVAYLDTSVIVTMLDGASIEEALVVVALATACLEVVRLEPDADAIAIAGKSSGWPTAVLGVPQLRTAFETPSGVQVPPRLTVEPLPVIDALAKFLETQVTAWEVSEPAVPKVQNLNLGQLALEAAVEAVNTVTAEGRRARTPAKRQAWTNLADDLGSRIAESIVSITTDEPTEAVLDDLIERGTQ
jgi:hypothetical protein